MSDPTPIAEALARLRDKAADPELDARVAERIAAEERSREESRRRQAESEWAKSGIPKRLFDLLASPEDTEAMAALRAWLPGGKTFLLLGGGVGVGKTVAAAAAVAQRSGMFRKARDIATLSQFDTEAWQRLYRTPMLAIDDLGTEALDEKGWALSAILALLDRRYDDDARTVITTNLSVDAVRARYGQDGGRLFDRLREAAEWVELAGGSLRKAAP